MKRSSVASAAARSPLLVLRVGQIERRLLRQQRAGGAAFDALEELDRLVVAAAGQLVLGLGVQFFDAPGSSSGLLSASSRSRERATQRLPASTGRVRTTDHGVHRVDSGTHVLAENEHDYRDAIGDDLAIDAGAERPRASSSSRRCTASAWTSALVLHAGEFSRSHLQGLIERGCVRWTGCVRARLRARLRAGPARRDRAAAHRRKPGLHARADGAGGGVRGRAPAGASTSPPAWWCIRRPGTGAARCSTACWRITRGAALLPRAGIVHRLDKDTSGLMVVAKTLPAMTALVRAIAAREVQREYLALAHGVVPAAPFSIEAPIGRDPVSRVRMAVVGERQAGAHRRQARWPHGASSALCCAACTPAARTRSACTWRRAAIRWWPTRSTAARRRWA